MQGGHNKLVITTGGHDNVLKQKGVVRWLQQLFEIKTRLSFPGKGSKNHL